MSGPPTAARVSPTRLDGTVTCPPSKSVAHRVLIAAALAASDVDPTTLVELGAGSDDVTATLQCLRSLVTDRAQTGSDTIALNVGESGSTLRFILPIAAALGRRVRFDGRGRLASRPLAEYRDILAGHGVELGFPAAAASPDPAARRFLPVEVAGVLRSGVFRVPGGVSSQYLTGLLLALPLTGGASEVQVTSPLQSAPYVDITIDVLRQFGIDVERAESDGLPAFRLAAGQRYRLPAGVDATHPFAIEGDWSQAAFWLVAQYLGHPVRLIGLRGDSVQGDRRVVEALAALRAGKHRRIDVADIPDAVPALAVAAAVTPGRTTFAGAERLRLKESDRLALTASMLRAFDVEVDESEASLTVTGRELPLPGGASIETGADHRMVMAAAIMALAADAPTTIGDPASVAKSYPQFWDELRRLGGSACVEAIS